LKVAMPPEHSTAVGTLRPAEPDLVRKAQAGDAGAFRALYEAHFGFALRTCLRLGLSEADAEDAVQETFAVAHRSLARFVEGRFSTWLYRIAANVTSARLRRIRVRDALLGRWLSREEPLQAAPDGAFDEREAARMVRELVARLAPKKREVFALFELEGLSGEEIAERVGCPVATVWTRLHHARKDFERLARKRGLEP
jgi:RNA polymerase sigma-70 factor (ECF subfamily)